MKERGLFGGPVSAVCDQTQSKHWFATSLLRPLPFLGCSNERERQTETETETKTERQTDRDGAGVVSIEMMNQIVSLAPMNLSFA